MALIYTKCPQDIPLWLSARSLQNWLFPLQFTFLGSRTCLGLGTMLGHQKLHQAIHDPICLLCRRLLLLLWAPTHEAGNRSPLRSMSSVSAPKTSPGTHLHSALLTSPTHFPSPCKLPIFQEITSRSSGHGTLQARELLGENLGYISMS